MLFPYFITVYHKLHTSGVSMNMHQFSVTEQERVVSNKKGSNGVSGIFIKLMVRVREEHMPLCVSCETVWHHWRNLFNFR
uniref:Uncharacterized protein n=1 Tax=Cyprinus carpio TaxID=7962 RepID=A0A8C1UU63_CYPCA